VIRIVFCLVFTTLVGCTGGVVGIEGFNTDIRYDVYNDGSKRFYFSAQRDLNRGLVRSRHGTFDPEAFRGYMDRTLLQLIETDGFCREGYFVIDRSDHPENGFVRGECRDSATPEDVAKWSSN